MNEYISAQPRRTRDQRRHFSGRERATIVYAITSFVLILVILQLWLLTATMNAYLGGDESVIWPALLASLLCFLLNLGLLWYIWSIERT